MTARIAIVPTHALLSPTAQNFLGQRGCEVVWLADLAQPARFGSALPPESVASAAQLDLEKAAHAGLTDSDPDAAAVLDALRADLVTNRIRVTNIWNALRLLKQQPGGLQAVVVPCSFDVVGAAVIASARELGIASVHVPHASTAVPPGDASWAAAYVPDYTLVAGERDRQWWRSAAQIAGHGLRMVGQPLWDGLSSLSRRNPSQPTILRVQESGQNAYQSTGVWHSRKVPETNWQAFLVAVRRLPPEVAVIIKVRDGEDTAIVNHWLDGISEVAKEQPDRPIEVLGGPMRDVLPRATVVLCEDSNAGIEALHLGIPVISVTREGGCLFRTWEGYPTPVYQLAHPMITVLQGEQANLSEELGTRLMAALFDPMVTRSPLPLPERLAEWFNVGIDGQATQRVVQAICSVAQA